MEKDIALMDLEGIALNGVSQRMPYDFTYMWNLKNKINNNNKRNRNKLIDTENIWRVTRWERGWGVGTKRQRG